jgi:hypothetical protein
MIKPNTDPTWLMAMAEKEDNSPISVGGLLYTLAQAEDDGKEQATQLRASSPRFLDSRMPPTADLH